MEKKIKELTDLLTDGTYDTEVKCSIVAFESEMYEQAWEHLNNVYNAKDANVEQKGKAAYYMCCVLKKIPNDHPIIKQLMEEDKDLIKISASKPITNEYARKYMGRKYLKFGAECDCFEALREYGLNCVGSGANDDFKFEYNEANAEAGLAWANRMIKNSDKNVRVIGYAIQAKHYFIKSLKDPNFSNTFCDCALKAHNESPNNQYSLYFMGQVYASPSFAKYKNGQYHNPAKGYENFCRVIECGNDEQIVGSSLEYKKMFEEKFPNMIRRKY